jgi:hypothetical protein
MTTATTFETVKEAYHRVYQQLREDNKENAPSSYTWIGQTRGELAEQIDSNNVRPPASDAEPDNVIGDPDGETIAWAYECNGRNLFRITETASENALVTLFGRCMGYDL